MQYYIVDYPRWVLQPPCHFIRYVFNFKMRLSTILSCLFFPFAFASPVGGKHPKDRHKCTEENAIQRKEWSSMDHWERKSYINAVKCLMEKPSLYSPGTVHASASYYDDFAVSHANLSLSIHFSGTFLGWHRHFLHLMEEALHNECGYPDYLGLPYWNWPHYTDHPLEESTLFDGSETSLGSNGAFIPNRDPPVLSVEGAWRLNGELSPGTILPLGTGGGCLVKGPFSDTTVFLDTFSQRLPDNWTEARPQCRRRDLNDKLLRLYNHQTRVDNIMRAPDIVHFQYRMDPTHGRGHGSVGGHMGNFFVSPLDPVFWLHHGQVDRLWAVWQAEDEARRFQYNGTSTTGNPVGVTPEVDDDTVLTFHPVGREITLRESVVYMSGRYCYIYV